MPRKRDGPRIAANDQGPEQGVNERPAPLPQAQTPRNTQGHISPSAHPRIRRRQDPSWRGFAVRLYAPPGSDGAHALYAFLKLAAQRYGREVASADKIRENDHEDR
jgi:hypothetical protein